MATIYNINIKTVSAFQNYNEQYINDIFKKFLKDYRDPKSGLGFENTEIEVIRK